MHRAHEPIDPGLISHAADLILQADSLVIAAGAGMGVDSGLPDFRGKEGFWKAYPALGAEQVDFYRIACPEAFRKTPERAWGFYGHRLALYRATVPHAGFRILRRWGEKMFQGHTVFTSNVDGQFQLAGFDDSVIHECHGSLQHLQCLALCSEQIWEAGEFQPVVDEERCLLRSAAPTCPRCGGMARPNVMMFSDFEWLEARQATQARRQEAWLSKVRAPVVIEIGAGTDIPTVRHFSHRVIHEFCGRLIRINPREYSVPTPFDVGIASGALAAVAAIDQEVDDQL